MNLGDPIAPAPPHDWQHALPEPASEAMTRMSELYHLFEYLAYASLAVLFLALCWTAIRYNARIHPSADRHKDDSMAMIGFVGASAVVLVLAAVPALRFAGFVADAPKPDITVEVVGRTGYWTYVYPGEGHLRFESHRLGGADAAKYHQPAQMAVDLPLMVPVGQTVELAVTSTDIVHVWSVPALGVGTDAIPGRVNRLWFKATKPGIYYGLCGEACGGAGTVVPIAVKVVSEDEYRGWLAWARREYAAAGTHLSAR